jgi:glycosyltransferase involved in cell wall biosynthesis
MMTLADKLHKNAVESFIMSFTYGPMVDKLKSVGVQVAVIPAKDPLDWRLFFQFRKLVDECGIKLIHKHGSWATAFMFLLAVLKRLKMVDTIRGWSFHLDQSFWLKYFRKKWERGILYASDIFIFPFLWEGLPVALLEAMDMVNVVLLSALDGTSELIQHQENGLLLNVSDRLVRHLGESISEVLSDDFLYNYLFSKARIII